MLTFYVDTGIFKGRDLPSRVEFKLNSNCVSNVREFVKHLVKTRKIEYILETVH